MNDRKVTDNYNNKAKNGSFLKTTTNNKQQQRLKLFP